MSNLSQLKPIPHFNNEEEERNFWLTHDSVDYVDWSKAQKGQFQNLRRTPKEVSRKIYSGFFLQKAAIALLVISIFLLTLSSVYELITHKFTWSESVLHLLPICAAVSLIYMGLAAKYSHQVTAKN